MAIVLHCSNEVGSQSIARLLAGLDSTSADFALLPPRFKTDYTVPLRELYADYDMYPEDWTPIL